ncbi:platelet binding protein GspB-like [Amphibalanus amphitrite]|uniref:platelet binding protein GspB-like n=1 Tax=Amphibalanus amphitrite TaxID=1232801 RepID=UPI001C901917|nr:platelet binding protein GspB-like [Amphibalanus amphitrite]
MGCLFQILIVHGVQANMKHFIYVLMLYLHQWKLVISHNPGQDNASDTIQNSAIIDLRVIYNTSQSFQPSKQGYVLGVQFEYHRKNYILDLWPNSYVEGSMLRYKKNGAYVKEHPMPHERDWCLYTGSVRGAGGSSAALSTCDGVISAVISEPGRTMVLSPAAGGRYLLEATEGPALTAGQLRRPRRATRRRRRETTPLRRPLRARPNSLYLELVLAVDHEIYRRSGYDLSAVHRRVRQLANIVHSIFAPLDIFVALVGVDVWSEGDQITLSANADDTLTNFLFYRRERLASEIPSDNAQLITATKFDGGIVGKARDHVMCTSDKSGGVSTDRTMKMSRLAVLASTVAHEMGHNLGLQHDTPACECPARDDRCVMYAASTSSVGPTQWSSCSREQLKRALKHGLGHCLHDIPTEPLLSGSVCGNGFLETEEECDCGLPADCTTPCCDPLTCRLRRNGTCAGGACCDPQTCQPRAAGSPCRPARGECDLPEFCTGESNRCPGDVHKLNGLSCGSEKAHCYDGQCSDRDDQCRLLWGPSGNSSVEQCYHQNVEGNHLGDCGFDWHAGVYTACRHNDALCGRLHCVHLNERLEYGVESSAKLNVSYVKAAGKVQTCRTAIVDLGLRQRDPGLVPQGAPCGPDKMCVDQRCVSVSTVTEGMCPDGCSGRGVCNSRGNCHCQPGWAPPNCTQPGSGGSVDSGPYIQSDAVDHTTTVILCIFVLLVLAVAIAAYFCCRRRGLSPLQLVPSCAGCCRLPSCQLPNRASIRLPSCPTLPGLTALRRKLPTAGGRAAGGGGGGGEARSVRRAPTATDGPPEQMAPVRVPLMMLREEGEELQPDTGGAPARPPPPASVPASSNSGRGTNTSGRGRLLNRPGAAAQGAEKHSDKQVCKVEPSTKPSAAQRSGASTTSPSRQTAGGGSGVQKVVADALKSSQQPRTTFGMVDKQQTKADVNSTPAAGSGSRTTFGMSRPDGGKAAEVRAAGPSVTAGGWSGPAAGPESATDARAAFLSRGAAGPPRPTGPPPTRAVTGQVKAAAGRLQDKPAAGAGEPPAPAEPPAQRYANVPNTKATAGTDTKPVNGGMDRKYANIPEPSPAPGQKTAATNTGKAADSGSRMPNIRSLLESGFWRDEKPVSQEKPTAAAERIPLVQRSESVPAAPAPPAVPQVRFAPVSRTDSAPASPRPSGPDSRSSTLESERGSTLERDGSSSGGAGSRPSTLSRVASVFRRGDKAPDSPPAAAESSLRPSQSFKAAKLDRDKVRSLGISNPIPQPIGQFSTLPTSPGGRRGQRPPVRTSSDVGRPLRPASLLVRPSEPPPRPPNAAELYDDCNMDTAGGVTPTDNLYCTIDEVQGASAEERPRPRSMLEPGVGLDGTRLYQNTAPWRSVGSRQPTVSRVSSAAGRTDKAWSPIVEERPVVEQTSNRTAETQPSAADPTAVGGSGPTGYQSRRPLPWAAKFTANPIPSSSPLAPTFSRPLSASVSAQKPTATVAPASQQRPAAKPDKTIPEYAKPTPRSAAASTGASTASVSLSTTASTDSTALSTTTSTAPAPAVSGGTTIGSSAKQSQPAKQTGGSQKASNESPASVRSVKSTTSAKSAASSSSAPKKPASATSSKQPASSALSSKQTSSSQSSKPAGQSSKKAATPSSSSRPGSLSAASSQQSMSSTTSSRSNVNSPSSERSDGAPGAKTGTPAKKTGTAAAKKAGKAAAGGAAGTKAAGGASGKKTAVGGRPAGAAGDSAEKTGGKTGSAAAAAAKSLPSAGKTGGKEGAAARVGPAPTKASAARAAAAAAKVSAAAAKSSASSRPGGARPATKS